MLKVIKLIIILLLTFLLVVMFSLFSGIKIDSFSLGDFSISKLYIKFDKKLILEVEKVIFNAKKSTVENSSEDIQKNISKFSNVLKAFQRIDIENLKIKDNHFTITLNDKYLYLDNKYINIAADLDYNEPQIDLNIHSLYLKDLDLTFIGKSKIDLKQKAMSFYGGFLHKKNIEGEINLKLDEKIFEFYVNSNKSIKSIKFLRDLFRLDSVAEAWMYDNVTGDMSLNYLQGKIDVVKKEPILDSIKGQAIIKNAKIKFHKNAKAVDTKKLTIDYKDDTLFFTLDKPTYNKSKIYGSKVYIPNLTSKQKGKVIVDLKTKSMLNNDILGILKAYNINLPLKQKSGKLDSSLVLKIPYLDSRKMEVDGIFNLKDSVLKLNDFEFLAKKAKVILKDNLVTIKESNLIHKDMLNANLNLVIDTKTSTAKGNALINSFKIDSEDESIIKISALKTDLFIDFKKSTTIDLKALKTKLDISTKRVNIDIPNLSAIFNYSKLLKVIDIKEGDLNIDVFDKNNISFKINAKNLDLPFEENGNKIEKLSASGTIQGNLTTIKTDDSDIEIFFKDKKNPLLKLNNINLALNRNSTKNKKSEQFPNIDLELKNSTIKLDGEHEYKTSWANIHIKNSKISFEGQALELDLPIALKGEKVKDLILVGTYENEILDIKSKDNKLKLKYEMPEEKLTMKLNGYDVLYDTSIEEDKSSKIVYYISGINSNIIMNDKYIAKATNYNFIFEDNKTDIDLKYKDTKFIYRKDYLGNIYVDARNMNDKFLNALMNKNLIEGGSVNLKAKGENGVIKGEAILKDTKIADLAILNNLLIFINTSPALINPFLAIPSVVGMATSDGFNLNGYKVTKGRIDFSYDFKNKFLNMNKIFTKGNGIDFNGFATIDFDSSKISSKLKLIFLKDYSKIVGAIPVINYVLLGDENRVDTQVEIYGTIDKPEYRTELAKESVTAPVNVIKRIIISPVKLIESIGKSLTKEDNKEKEKEKDKAQENE